jgi:hypothetical protein
MNFAGLTKSVIDALFNMEGEHVKTVTYVRPTSLSGESSSVETLELRITAKAVVPHYAPAGFSMPHHRERRVLMKAADLTSVTPARAGDFIVLPDGTRFDVLLARLDVTAQFWALDCAESNADDYGDLTAFTSNADNGDLTTYTNAEDRGAIWQ